jgi:hypothetical protein
VAAARTAPPLLCRGATRVPCSAPLRDSARRTSACGFAAPRELPRPARFAVEPAERRPIRLFPIEQLAAAGADQRGAATLETIAHPQGIRRTCRVRAARPRGRRRTLGRVGSGASAALVGARRQERWERGGGRGPARRSRARSRRVGSARWGEWGAAPSRVLVDSTPSPLRVPPTGSVPRVPVHEGVSRPRAYSFQTARRQQSIRPKADGPGWLCEWGPQALQTWCSIDHARLPAVFAS